MKRYSILIFALLICLQGFAQKIIINGEETNRPLKWADFTGKVDKGSRFFAYTYYHINSKYTDLRIYGDSVSIGGFEVVLIFDPVQSWAVKSRTTDELLEHEQGHFNIGILCMNEILTRFRQTKFTKDNYRTTMDGIMNETMKKYHELALRYDAETSHSGNEEQQQKWNEYILKSLPK